MNKRLKELRSTLKLSQQDFGSKLGITKASISRLESGVNNFTEQMIKSVCREFNLDYLWFTEGIGEMFNDIPETIIDELVIQYDLDDLDRSIIQEYLKLDAKDRTVIKNYIKNIFIK